MAAPVTVRLQALDGVWETAGVDRVPGVHPESVQLASNEWGYDTCSFTLKRPPDNVYPDLSAFTPCEVEIGGRVVWEGRVRETPSREGADAAITVQGQGWQYHLDDDVYERMYVHTRLSDWRDSRAVLNNSTLGRPATAAANVEAGDAGISIGWPRGTSFNGGTPGAAVQFDAGPNSTVKRVVFTYEKPSATTAAGLFSLYLRGADGDDIVAGGSSETPYSSDITALGASGTVSVTFTTARRYVAVILHWTSGGGTAGEDNTLKLTSVKLFRDTVYESGNASILKSKDVVKDARNAVAPLLSTSDELIDPAGAITFNMPEFAMGGYQTPREVMSAVNAYHRWRLRVLSSRRLAFQAQATAPIYEAGSWSGAQFEDASMNSGEEIYNRVIVEGTGPDGTPLRVTRTQTGTLVNRRGFTRTKILPVSSAITQAAAEQIGDVFLSTHRATPLRGSMSARLGGVRRVLTGDTVHPSELLANTTEIIRFSHRVDPDTGAMGRDGVIAGVSYDHASETASVTIDNARDNLETLLNRMAAVSG